MSTRDSRGLSNENNILPVVAHDVLTARVAVGPGADDDGQAAVPARLARRDHGETTRRTVMEERATPGPVGLRSAGSPGTGCQLHRISRRRADADRLFSGAGSVTVKTVPSRTLSARLCRRAPDRTRKASEPEGGVRVALRWAGSGPPRRGRKGRAAVARAGRAATEGGREARARRGCVTGIAG